MLSSGCSRIASESKLILIVSRSSWLSSLKHLLKSPTYSSSLGDLVSPPSTAKSSFKNGYIPLTRRTLFRELLQDGSVIIPSERENFEKVAISLDQKLKHQFNILQDELSVLSQSIEPMIVSSLSGKSGSPLSTDLEFTAFRSLSETERLDREFWLLRQISDLAPTAGFTEVSRDLVEKACEPHRVPKASGAVSFVDPNKYAVIHFWVRGIHHHLLTFPDQLYTKEPTTTKQKNTEKRSGGKTAFLSALLPVRDTGSWQPKDWLKWAGTALLTLTRRSLAWTVQAGRQLVASRFKTSNTGGGGDVPDILHQPGGKAGQLFEKCDLCISKVLMAVKMKGDNSVHVKLFENVPSPTHGTPTDSLALLLPQLTYSPLSGVGRFALLASGGTALVSLGLVAPATWLLSSSPELGLAWCLATAAAAGLTGSSVWARYWRARSALSDRLRQIHYHCGHNTGQQAIASLLRLAHEELFKSSLLAYALLIRPSQAGVPLNPTQLGVRAESWVAKRLKRPQHIPLPASSKSSSSPDRLRDQFRSRFDQTAAFTGGSGPLFDLDFCSHRPLDLLRRLDLVRGSQDAPTAVPVSQAASSLRTSGGRDVAGAAAPGSVSRLWLLDSLACEADLGRG